MSVPKSCAVIGGGPAGLMAAETLAEAGCHVTVYDQMPSFGRKLLMAGVGGLNLTHSEGLGAFLSRYRGMPLGSMVEAFPPEALRGWCEDLGQETFVGSSGRVFPRSLKASPLLRAWLRRLSELGVQSRVRHRWTGWQGDALAFDAPDGPVKAVHDATILALGGASWAKLGSDGAWSGIVEQAGVATAPFKPANCSFEVDWREHVGAKFAGTPMKSMALSFGDRTVRGEAMVSETGIEGGAVYALSPDLRDAIDATGSARLIIDLKPDNDLAELAARLEGGRQKDTVTSRLRKVGLPPVSIAVLREGVRPLPQDPFALAEAIKAVPIMLTGTGGMARAISSAGGVRAEAIDPALMLRAKPGCFVAGEMLDWEAPTGGYLLQACFASGRAAARGALDWLDVPTSS
ncbi:TIGR03862 family flavoprotein [bacterium]|nr:TIGR03862 family flavoprotein [bacterium]